MKVAIVQDWFVCPGGSEKVVEKIIQLFPEADVHALINVFSEDHVTEFLHNKKVKTSFLQRIPKNVLRWGT